VSRLPCRATASCATAAGKIVTKHHNAAPVAKNVIRSSCAYLFSLGTIAPLPNRTLLSHPSYDRSLRTCKSHEQCKHIVAMRKEYHYTQTTLHRYHNIARKNETRRTIQGRTNVLGTPHACAHSCQGSLSACRWTLNKPIWMIV
jgi:hypothetical protein